MRHSDRLDRRRFLAAAGAASLTAATAPLSARGEALAPPGVDISDLERAHAVLGLEFDEGERTQMLRSVQGNQSVYEQLRKIGLENGEAPAEVFDPALPGMNVPSSRLPNRFRDPVASPLPSSEEDIAFASIAELSHWIRSGQISSVELTELYLGRLARFSERLECVITLTDDLARAQARRADAEIARGGWRGPLHGLPYGIKDLFDTKDIRTTWGATPYQDRVADRDATVVEKLRDAGAVLVAKLTLGALAYGDVWFDGVTRNPFLTKQGSSGSSAGSASATAAGLVAFTLGTETYGSIGSPSARCGATGFRPTFGRVSRYGAMALCWSLDKVGPICRSAEDTAFVLGAIDGIDPRDPSTRGVPLNLDMTQSVEGLRVGYFKEEYESRRANEADKETLAALEKCGVELVPIAPPPGDWGSIIGMVIDVEAACAFDELTRSDQDDLMVRQQDSAWPNLFRASRLIPAVEALQASRVRRRGMEACRDLFDGIDAVIAPQRHGTMHGLTNLTGNPAVTLRQAFRDDGTPRAVTLWGRVHDDAALLRLAVRLEEELGLWRRRPDLS